MTRGEIPDVHRIIIEDDLLKMIFAMYCLHRHIICIPPILRDCPVFRVGFGCQKCPPQRSTELIIFGSPGTVIDGGHSAQLFRVSSARLYLSGLKL